jgi:hypothetical protein
MVMIMNMIMIMIMIMIMNMIMNMIMIGQLLEHSSQSYIAILEVEVAIHNYK